MGMDCWVARSTPNGGTAQRRKATRALMNHGIEAELTGDYDSASFKLDRVQQN
jgi:hypothetical protein